MEFECQTSNQLIVKGLELQLLQVNTVPFMLIETSAGSLSQGIHLLMTE